MTGSANKEGKDGGADMHTLTHEQMELVGGARDDAYKNIGKAIGVGWQPDIMVLSTVLPRCSSGWIVKWATRLI